ncbi:MAG: beta-propeller domain-containing protein [Lachnospiraceae bacterium]|nr:beta-propeller domain-containing protein [Lachnospiraceae bacterium]
MNSEKDTKILDKINQEAENIQIPDSLSPDNMMKRIAEMKEEGAFKEAKDNKNNKKRNKRKLISLISGGMATVIAAASVGIILLGSGARNVNNDMMIYKDVYDNVAQNGFSEEKIDTLSSYEDLARYYMAQQTIRRKETVKDKFYKELDRLFGTSSKGEIYNDGVVNSPSDDLITMRPETEIKGEENQEETTPEYSETNTRTENVGEADVVKTDGKYIYYLNSKKEVSDSQEGDLVLTIVKADGDKTSKVYEGSISEPIINAVSGEKSIYYSDKEMLVYENKLVAICNYGGSTVLSFYDIEDRANPQIINTLFMEGIYDSCRFVDGYLYVFSEKNIGNKYYDIYEDAYDGIVLNDYVNNEFKDTSIEELKDKLSVCTSEGDVNPEDIYVANCEKFELYHMIGTVDMADTKDFKQVKAVLGQASGTIYVSANNIYYIDSVYESNIDAREGAEVEECNKSEIIRLSYGEGDIKASGRTVIDGKVGDEFAIDEYNGYLRVAVSVDRWKGRCQSVKMEYYNGSEWVTEDIKRIHPYTYSEYRETSALYVLNANLEVVGSIPELKKNEKVYGVRFDGDIAYVVTYKVMDPLFSIDLSDPTNPTVLGALKIPGFSTYLHKWDDNKLVGIGYNDDWNIKISTFDISDKTDVKETDVCILEDVYGADAVYNHKAIFISPKNNLLGFGDDDGHYRIFSYVGSELTEVICVELADGYLNEARALYIGDYIYIVGENRGVFVYSMSDFEMVTEIK